MSNLLDLTILTTLKDVIGDDLNDIIDSFLELLPGQLESIQKSIADNDPTALRLHAHTLKGSASNVGASGLSDIALEMESLAKKGDAASANAHFANLAQTARETESALRQFMA